MKQLSLKDPLVQIAIISIAIITTIYFSAQKFILKPNKDKITKLKTQLQHIELEDEIAKLYKEVNSSEKTLAPQKDQSWLLTQLTSLAKQSNVKIESVEPLPVKQIPPYSYVPFKIKTDCIFAELINFVRLVESSAYILSIESLKIDSKEKYSAELPNEEMDKQASANTEIVIGTIY